MNSGTIDLRTDISITGLDVSAMTGETITIIGSAIDEKFVAGILPSKLMLVLAMIH